MGDIIEKYIGLLDEEEYGKLIKVLSSIFMIIAPSFSFIFLFKRELFTELDIFKLIILCIIINATLFSIIYLFTSAEIYATSILNVKKQFKNLEELETTLNESEIKLEILEKKKKDMNETKLYKAQD